MKVQTYIDFLTSVLDSLLDEVDNNVTTRKVRKEITGVNTENSKEVLKINSNPRKNLALNVIDNLEKIQGFKINEEDNDLNSENFLITKVAF